MRIEKLLQNYRTVLENPFRQPYHSLITCGQGMIAGTLQTDPRSGGIKRSSGVNVLPIVAETWARVRDESDASVDWLLAGYVAESKTDVAVLGSGNGGVGGCSLALPARVAVFGGCRLGSGRFVTFFYADEGTPVMQRGRASMHKNGVLNVLEGSDCEIDMKPGLTEEQLVLPLSSDGGSAPSDERRSAPTLKVTNEPEMEPPVAREETDARPCSNESESSGVGLPVSAGSENAPAISGRAMGTSAVDFVPYSQLKDVHDVADLPPGVDPTNREQSLSDDEFTVVFGMNKQRFRAQPAWKRTNQKKAKGLF